MWVYYWNYQRGDNFSASEIMKELSGRNIQKIIIKQTNKTPTVFVDPYHLSITGDAQHIEEFDCLWNRTYKCLHNPNTTCQIKNLLCFAEKVWNPKISSDLISRYRSKIGFKNVTPDGIYDPKNKYCLDNISEKVDLSSYPKITAKRIDILGDYTGYVPKIVLRHFDFGEVKCLCDELIILGTINTQGFYDFENQLRKFLSEANVRFIEMRIFTDNPHLIKNMEFKKTNLELYNIIVGRKSVRIPGLDAAMNSNRIKNARK